MVSELFCYLSEQDRLQARELAGYIARRDWVLFVGSGISRPSGLPLWRDLVNLMVQRLGKEAASEDPLEVASLFEANLGRNALVTFLRDHLQTLGLSPNLLHNRLLDLRPPVIVTTNFDDLLEHALAQRSISYTLVIDDRDLAITGNALSVIKPHGDLKHWDSLVFTRQDYARYPRQKEVNHRLRTLVAQHAFFFVGYSLNDHDLERQFEKLLDAQGELARYHYLVVDKVTHLHRSAFLKRNIRVIELGSYTRLEQFLVALSMESARYRVPATAQPIRIVGNTEALQLDAAEQMLLALLAVDYAPISEALQGLRLVDAETHLQQILTKLQHVQSALAHMPGLRDFHQRVLLALGTVAVRRKRYAEARVFYHQARELQPFAGRRCLQATEVLLSLGELQAIDTLLADCPEANEPRGRELLGLVALLRNDQARFHALYPTEAGDHVEFAIQHARLAVEAAQDATVKEALRLLDQAWHLSQDFPPGQLAVVSLTDELLRRVIIAEWEAPGIDRREFLRTLRIRCQQVVTVFEVLADQYQEGFIAALAQLLALHIFLEEEEAQPALLARLQSLASITPERVLAEHFAGIPSSTLDVVEEFFQKGHFSLGQKALIMGAALVRDGKSLAAEQLYRQVLSAPEPPEERHVLIEALLKIMLEEARYEAAFAYLDETTSAEEPFRAVMRGMICLSRNDRENALVSLRNALERHPRNTVLLQQLAQLLSTQQETNGNVEALHYAERLEALLPSFEHTLYRARLLARSGHDQDYQEALQLVSEVEREGYVTLPMLELKADLLERLGKNRQAAEFLTSYRGRYPDNYLFRSKEAIAWAKAGGLAQAIAIWEELRYHAKADGDLYRNLVQAYILYAPQDPGSCSTAFDIARTALEKFPARQEFAALLLDAAMGSGRQREAWEIIGQRPELLEGPYIQALSEEKTLEVIRQEAQILRSLDSAYRAGVIPFPTYAEHSPRSPLFLWQVRSHLWHKGLRTATLLCGFSRDTLPLQQPESPDTGVILDMTALLTLGTLNVAREILDALGRTGKPIFLFPGARQWLEKEVAKLSMDQWPAYRRRHKRLQEILLATREKVELVTGFVEQRDTLDPSVRQRLGMSAWDIEIAIDRGCLYVGDYLSPEVQKDLSSLTVLTSSDFLAALERAGILFSEDIEQMRQQYPDPFALPTTGTEVSLDRPVMLPWPVLVTWCGAGLLERWLQDRSGWPLNLVIGPTTWSQLSSNVTEDEIYQEALQLAQELRACIVEALDNGYVEELSANDPPDLGGDSALRTALFPTLTLLAEARKRSIALWSDDLCSHLLVDPHGPLVQEPAVVDMAMRVRQTFSAVPVIGTEGILQWLAAGGHFPRERQLTLVWQLHCAGYRFLNVGEVLLWLLKRFQYNYKAVPVAVLLHDLETAASLSIPHVDSQRLSLFVSVYLSGVLSAAIAGLWHLQDPVLTRVMKRILSTKLTTLFERTTSPAITQKLFWQSLVNRLRIAGWEEPTQEPQQRIANLHASMEWLAEFVLADLDHRRPILQEVEENILDILRYFHRDLWDTNGQAEAFTRIVIGTILKAFSSQGLAEEFDPDLQRLIGYVLGLEATATQSFEVKGLTGESFNIIVTEDEVERQACEILKLTIAGQQSEQLKYLFPLHMDILLQRMMPDSIGGTADSQPLRLPISQIPLLCLPLVADASLRQQLFEHFRSWFAVAEPPLAQIIDTLLPDLIADDPSFVQTSLRNFYRTYLLSTHFQITRDLARGFDYLEHLDLKDLDDLCRDLPVWPQGASFQEVIEASLKATEPTQASYSSPQKPVTWFVLLGTSRLAFSQAKSSETILSKSSDGQRAARLSHWIETVKADANVFYSLTAGLELLLHIAYRFPDLKVDVEDTERSLREWLTEHLLKILIYQPQNPISPQASMLNPDGQLPGMSQPQSVGKRIPVDQEFLRRSMHAKLLHYAFRAVASRSHLDALREQKGQTQMPDLLGELLIRGIMLAYRLLPMFLHHTRMPLEQIDQYLTKVLASQGSPWPHLYAQDQFNPELYGPAAGQYDHLLAGTLAVFREVSFDRATTEGTASASVPFWLTQPVKRALMALANRPENEAERRVREARERGVPNRLQTYLDHTPQEYAAALLRFASPSLSKEEELLRTGQVKLLELFRHASEEVNIDMESHSGGTDRPDMIARVKVGGEEKRIFVEAKTSSEPRHLRQMIVQLQSYLERFSASYGLIVVPSISERGGKLCEEHGIGYMDLQGNASIKFAGMFIKTVATRKGKRPRGRTKALFAPVSTRLVRALFASPERRWKLLDLAAAAQVSLGQAHKVKQALLNQEFIDTDPKRRLFLKDPAGLLNAWRETYRYEKNKTLSLFALDKLPVIEEKVRQYCDTRKIRYALTLFSGAEKLAPFVRSSLAAFYMLGAPEELVQTLQLKPVDSGANILLFSPYDAGVFYGLQEGQGFQIVSTIQLYLDLYSYGSRGREQAEFLREKLLGF